MGQPSTRQSSLDYAQQPITLPRMSNPFPTSAPVANQSLEESLIKVLQILTGTAGADGSLKIKVVGGTAPAGFTNWGGITGTLTNQADLVTYIANALASVNPAWGNITGTLTNQTDLVTYVSTQIGNALVAVTKNKGGLDASASPNYPAATINDLYYVTQAGKVGGASGAAVEVGDVLVCINTTAGGTQAGVGANWIILQTNIPGLTTVGLALATVPSPSAVRYFRVNADNTVTLRTAAEILSDIGGQASVGFSTVGSSVATLTNPSAISFLRVNADNTVTALTAAQMLTALGGITDLNGKTGAVTLAAGTNITITPSGNTLTVAGTGGGASPIGAYAELYIADNANTQTMTLQNTWYLWNTAWVAGDLSAASVSTSGGTITTTQGGTYRITFQGALLCSADSQTLEVAVFKNGVYQSDHSTHFSSNSTISNVTLSGVLAAAPGDVFTVRFQNTTSAGKTIRVEDGNFSASVIGGSQASVQVAASDEITAITAGTGKITFRMPYAMTLTAVRASLTTAQASGSTFTVDVMQGGVSVLGTKATIANTSKTSVGGTPATIVTSALTDDAEMRVDVTQIGASGATGLKVVLLGTMA